MKVIEKVNDRQKKNKDKKTLCCFKSLQNKVLTKIVVSIPEAHLFA